MKIIIILSLVFLSCTNIPNSKKNFIDENPKSNVIKANNKIQKLINNEHKRENMKKNLKVFADDFNHLKTETSPYLLQHKNNPVNWYSWGNKAFKKAQKYNKPIFLSIGYSTCHWCHVMEHQSFEQKDVAKILNENFVAIKVDREERPDIDELYMDIAQKMTGRGGWPLTIIMTSNKEPFFAGTYFPKPNLIHLLNEIISEWSHNKVKISQITQNIMNSMKLNNKDNLFNNISKKILDNAINLFKIHYDNIYFGMQITPKFPANHQWKFLLKYFNKINDKESQKMVLNTLLAMRKGGIYDQIGYGIHRYSTDRKWLIPHFEKMLYDQAMYILALTEAYSITKNKIYKNIIEEIYTYLNRVMLDDEGAFYSAEDADSDGEEGKYYIWSKSDLENILNKNQKWIVDYYNVTKNGNFNGKNIFFINKSINLDNLTKEKYNDIKEINKKLLAIRDKRIKPHKDTKILLHWNAMLAWALSDAGHILNEKKYITSSKKILDFILNNMRNNKKELIRSYKTNIKGFLTDYSYFIMALYSYYEASLDAKYLKEAFFYADMMIDKFWDKFRFITVENNDNELPIKTESFYDGAKPSGQAIAINIIQKLSSIDFKYKKYIEISLNRILKKAKRYPLGYTQTLDTLDNFLSEYKEVVVTGNLKNEDTKKLLKVLSEISYPYKTVVLHQDLGNKEDKKIIEGLFPFIKEQKSLDNKATAYICQQGMCKKPTSNPKEMIKYLTE